MNVVGLMIASENIEASNGATFERRNPVSGSVATTAAAATIADAVAAVDAATAAFPKWSRSLPRARRAILSRAADLLAAREPDFVAAMAEEIGATAGWAHFNVMLAADMLHEAAALTTQITGEIIPSNRPGSTAMAVRQPAGVVLSMAPLVAQQEREAISRRTKEALAVAKARGVKLGNPNGAAALHRAGKGGAPLRAAIEHNAEPHARDLAPVVEDIRAGGATSLRSIAAHAHRRGGRWYFRTREGSS